MDAFSYGKIPDCEGYFLTHFHSDHYGGLTKAWSFGPIFCSQITANLVKHKLGVDEGYLTVLPMNEPTLVLPTIKVTLIDANHCPGSVLFVFDIQQSDATWTRHLHTGDFRANPEMCLHPLLRQPDNPTIDTLYLDTTYLNAKYGFPAQEECIQAACRAVESHIGIQDDARPKTALDRWIAPPPPPKKTQQTAFDALMTGSKVANRSKELLVVVGTYSIGKEKVFCGKSKFNNPEMYRLTLLSRNSSSKVTWKQDICDTSQAIHSALSRKQGIGKPTDSRPKRRSSARPAPESYQTRGKSPSRMHFD